MMRALMMKGEARLSSSRYICNTLSAGSPISGVSIFFTSSHVMSNFDSR